MFDHHAVAPATIEFGIPLDGGMEKTPPGVEAKCEGKLSPPFCIAEPMYIPPMPACMYCDVIDEACGDIWW